MKLMSVGSHFYSDLKLLTREHSSHLINQIHQGVHLKAAGDAVRINFSGKTDRIPNTIKAHCLLEYVKKNCGIAKQDEMSELLFKANFTDGVFLDENSLLSIAEDFGLKKNEVKDFINNEKNLGDVKEMSTNWKRRGITGVPCFIMNGQRTFSGAQDVDVFLKTIKKIID